MKKIKYLICLLALFVMPIIAKADVGMPDFKTYEAYIINEDGATLYEENIWSSIKETGSTIPYDTKVTVGYEYEYNKTYYGIIDYDGKQYAVELSDLKTINDKEKIDTDGKKYEFIAYEETIIYAGPSKNYDVVAKIKKGDKVTIIDSNTDDNWGSVKYNGKEGWVYYINGMTQQYDSPSTLAYSPNSNENELLVMKDISYGYSQPDDDSDKVNVEIKKGKKYKINYIYKKIFNYYYNITVDGKNIWLCPKNSEFDWDNYTAAFATSSSTRLLFDEENIITYNTYYDYDSKETVKVSKNKVYKAKYATPTISNYDPVWYLVEINGKDYWVSGYKDSESDYDEYKYQYNILYNEYKFTTKEDIELYNSNNNYSKDFKSIGTLEKGTYTVYGYDSEYYSYFYVDGKGWIEVKDKTQLKTVELNNHTEEQEDEEPTKDKEKDKKKRKNKEDDEKEESSFFEELSPKMIIVLCIVGALLVAITAIVTIKLVNKKNKKDITR